MNIIVTKAKFTVVNPTAEQLIALADLPSTVTVHRSMNTAVVMGDPASLYKALYALSCIYDIELS